MRQIEVDGQAVATDILTYSEAEIRAHRPHRL